MTQDKRPIFEIQHHLKKVYQVSVRRSHLHHQVSTKIIKFLSEYYIHLSTEEQSAYGLSFFPKTHKKKNYYLLIIMHTLSDT